MSASATQADGTQQCAPTNLRRLAAVALVLDLALAVWLFMPRREVGATIDPATITHAGRMAFRASIPAPVSFPLTLPGDSGSEWRSTLRLFESMRELRGGHARRQEIFDLGGGRFSHRSDRGDSVLLFSSSDGTDPRTSGRVYAWKGRPRLDHRVILAGCLLLLVQLVIVLARASERAHYWTRARASAAATAALLILAGLMQWMVLGPGPPRVLGMGDAGMVTGIIAASNHPDRFESDPVLGSRTSMAFYATVLRPIVTALDRFVSDLGTSYLLLHGPLVFLQGLGFYALGSAILSRRTHAFLLSLLTLAPVFTNGGDLWGVASEPLTRTLYGAALPYLLLGFLRFYDRGWSVVWLALALGATLYLHPVSQPSVAFACVLGAMMSAENASWKTRLGRAAVTGLLVLAFMGPYFPVYFSSGVGRMDAVIGSTLTGEARHRFLQDYFGALYYDVRIAVRVLLEGGMGNGPGGWGWRWLVWGGGLAALSVLGVTRTPYRRSARFLAFFFLGIVASSVGICALDQLVAARLGRQPMLIDLVRNTRFLIPILLTGAVLGLEALPRLQRPFLGARLSTVAITLLTMAWCYAHPTTLVRSLQARLGLAATAARGSDGASEIVSAAASLPRGSVFLPLGRETVGLALRYGALQPVAFLVKDLNLILYGVGGHFGHWMKVSQDLSRFRTTNDAVEAAARLDSAIERTEADYLLVEPLALTPSGRQAVARAGPVIAARDRWLIVSVGREKTAN